MKTININLGGCFFWILVIWLMFLGGCGAVIRLTERIGS